MVDTLPNWEQDIMSGDYSNVHEYSKQNIYQNGALYDPLDLVEHITKKKFSVDYFKRYIDSRYLSW